MTEACDRFHASRAFEAREGVQGSTGRSGKERTELKPIRSSEPLVCKSLSEQEQVPGPDSHERVRTAIFLEPGAASGLACKSVV
jgi:hypothetical protein